MTDTLSIKVKAMCIFERDGKLLASKHHDTVKDEVFYRCLGGHVEFGETAEVAMRREAIEELGSEIENLEYLDMIENIFVYNGKPMHEIVFLFKGDLVRKELYAKEEIRFNEGDKEIEVFWVDKSSVLSENIRFYPLFEWKKFLSV
ncbi:MAG: NUDIX domain-containing protein [Candidatus Taylorbacteria bacterium]|nr:NUDIX domain-containing protein [Candidatus Taylorbacteria bacterium]